MRTLVLVLLLAAAASLGAQQVLQPNGWTSLSVSSEKTVLEDLGGSPMYYGVAVAPLAPGGAYTLFAEWDDGKAMLVMVRGADPRVKSSSAPSGASKQAAINASGGKDWRINFKVDPRSPGNAGYIIFSSLQPGRTVRLLLKDPGDPDSVTTAPVKGSYVGTAFSTPVFVSGQADFGAAPAAAPAAEEGLLPLNTWVDITSPGEKSGLGAYSGEQAYYAVVPVRLERGGKYTLLAEWSDGRAMLLSIRGHDPAQRAPSAPSGTYGMVSLNTSGGNDERINFTVDPKSPGDLGYLVFPSTAANRTVRVMLKYPGDPDEVTTAVVKGSIQGTVYKTPLHVVAAGSR